MASSFAKRQKAAQDLGYSGYAQQRRARASGIGLKGADRPGGSSGGGQAGRTSSPGGAGSSVFSKRQKAAQDLGYSGYAEQRQARATGIGLKGADAEQADIIAKRRRIIHMGDKELLRLTENNRGEALIRGRVKGPDQTITITWEADGRAGPIRFTRKTTWSELSSFESFESYAETETAIAYIGGSWIGAISDMQVVLG